MVALRSHEADRFVTGGGKTTAVWLVFGADPGLVDERIQAIVKNSVDDPTDPFQFVQLASDHISDNPGLLADEWNALGLFSARRVIRLDLGTRDIQADVRQCLDNPNPDCTLVIRAGALKRDSAMRLLCERHKSAVAIECQADSAADIKKLIQGEVSDRGLEIGQNALDHLVATLGVDRRMTRNEIEKLTSFIGDRRSIELEDIEAIVADAAPRLGDVVVAAALRGDILATTLEAGRALTNPAEYAAILSSCLRTCLLIHRALAEIESGGSRSGAHDKALRSAGPMRKFLPALLENATSHSILASMSVIQEAIGKARRETALSEIISVRSLWSVALRAKRR